MRCRTPRQWCHPGVGLRTVRRFETGYLARLGEPTIDSAIDTAVWFVEWCRSNLDQAQVLRAGMRTFGPDDWSADDRAAADQNSDTAHRPQCAQGTGSTDGR